MRVSTSTFYDSSVLGLQQQSASLLKSQQQISSGRRILTPADDPVAAAQALQVSQSQSLNQQYLANGAMAQDSLTLEESALGNIGELLQHARDIINQAGDGALLAADRASLVKDLQGTYQQLLTQANGVDGTGLYLFGGYRSNMAPFSQLASGAVQYNGDQGQRLAQISATRQVAVSDSGDEVFRRITTGNGTFQTGGGTNSGSAVIDAGSVLDASKWNDPANSGDFTIKFALNNGVTTYDIVDNASGNSLLTGLAPGAAPYPNTYTTGSTIDLSQAGPPAFDFGAQVSISGAPADGDTFTIKSSVHQDVFQTLNDLQTVLGGASGATLTNGLASIQRNLDHAIANVLAARTSVGARLNELDAARNVGDDRNLQYSQTLSRLQDVDYAQAASSLIQQQTNLQAAQQSFVKVAGLSLFNYI